MDLLSAKQLQIPNFTGPLSLARLCIRAIRRICHPGTLPTKRSTADTGGAGEARESQSCGAIEVL